MKTRFLLAASAAFFMPMTRAATYRPTLPPGGLDTATVLYTSGTSVGSLARYLSEISTINNSYLTTDALQSALAGYLPLTGGSVSSDVAFLGKITVPDLGASISDREAANTKFVAAAIAAEASARALADTSLSTTLAAETKSREAAEASLNTTITAETSARKSAETTLSDTISSEAQTREEADTALTTTLNAEISDRKAAVSDLAASVTSTYAPLASPVLTGTPTAPTAKAGTDSTQLATTAYADNAVTTEMGSRKTADATLSDDLSAEAKTRADADSALTSSLTAETTARKADDTSLSTNIASEASSRESADTSLNDAVNSEATTREDADNTLTASINTETSARKAGDTSLSDKITSLNNTVALLSGATFTGAVYLPYIYVSAASRATSNDTTTYNGQGSIFQWNTYQPGDGATEFINVVPSGISGAGFRWFSSHTGWTSATELARATESAFTTYVPLSAPSITLSSVATSNPGAGAHYACINDAGTLYRSDTACN